MEEFEHIASGHINEEFQNLTKIMDSMTDEQRVAYANAFPVAIWTVAGPDKDNSFAISAN